MPKVEVHSLENGPNQVLVDGQLVVELCRCGHSSNKPICDGTHEEVGFESSEATTQIVD
jgi:CDGSH-type Zn-finger protein